MSTAVHFHDQHLDEAGLSFRDEVIAGLGDSPKALSPKYFYDERGSLLFEAICRQPEYYLTRTEEGILAEAAEEIAALVGPESLLVELGSGASRKVRLLLEAMRPSRYLGVDISRDFLLQSTRRLAADYPWLEVHAAWADFSERLHLPAGIEGRRVVAFFPGSSIGNFAPAEAEAFLGRLRQALPPGSGVLIGVDLVKDRRLLEAAYNDAAGVTAAFNLNLLERMRRQLGASVEPANFRHRAFFDAAASRIEMHLVSQCPQTIILDEHRFEFARGETLHTENSCKYSREGFQALARRAGYRSSAVWSDAEGLFSVHYLSSD
ncbi:MULTISPECIES: L-histidine N(alpha)-methyltransferase [Halomonas]|uniref:L-histidine N(Alpha)-methyltransferase n=1 Tax=Halomonas flagellata TaxID=2920385 RepID=A0ABS9RQR5_9GAMM|nr:MULTISPECIES: L-histidine N(alpha)-methyltransferase [Halomonas]MCH4562174.1 L-histidine N(alpha)-methyltransferase [Halomonas flagellata]PXY00181.1 L-histidine N(alpha)-methyltransferase [Halomonas sp. LBP4]